MSVFGRNDISAAGHPILFVPTGTPSEHQVNALLNASLALVGKPSGRAAYRALFAMAPGQPIVLVDPEIAARAEVRPAP